MARRPWSRTPGGRGGAGPGAARPLVAGAVAVVVLVAAGVVGWWVSGSARADVRGPLASALAAAPADTTLLGFTDWERVRAVDADDPDLRDLLTRSVLADLGDAVPAALGWSTDDVRWEAFAQDLRAGTLVVAPAASLPWSRVEAGLRDAGFSDDGDGAWSASPQVVLEAGLGDQFTQVRLLPRAGVLVAGTDAASADDVARAATGEDPALTSVRQAVDTAQVLADGATALLQAGSLGCEAAAVPEVDRPAADAAQATAGELEPFAYAGRSIVDRGGPGPRAQTVTFAMTFPEVATARAQAPVRLALSTGPFVGRTGRVQDQLRDPRVDVDQATVTLDFDRAADGIVLMLGTGPLLFASC